MMKKIIKDRILFFIIGGIIFSCITAYAAYKYQATEVGYNPSNSNFDVDNVSDAIKELYAMNSNCETSSSTDILGNMGKSSNFLPTGYYKSTADDNNVIFGGYCWKIIRKTDDDDIRILYNGLPQDGECNRTGTDTQIDTSKYSDDSTITNYNDSKVKEVVDNWYNTNLATSYSDKISGIDLITREEASTVGGGYLVSGQQYWTQNSTGNTTSASGSCNYNNCGGSGSCNGTSNTMYIVGTNGSLETNNNGTYSSCSPTNKTCNGSCTKYWSSYTDNSGNRYCVFSTNQGYGCCEYAKLTGSCTATPQGSSLAVRPVITLKSNAILQGGEGTTSNPYYLN